MSGKALPRLTRVQILTYASCRLLHIIHFVEDWYLHICAKHAFKKSHFKSTTLKTTFFSKHFGMKQNVASLVTACRFC